MEWTAENIWELVKGWPEGARADIGCQFVDTSTLSGASAVGVWRRAGCLAETPDAHAAALHVASGLEWLARQGLEVGLGEWCDGGVYVEVGSDGSQIGHFVAVDLLRAVGEAVLVIESEATP